MYDMSYQMLMEQGALDQFAEPISPFMTAKGIIEKMEIDTDRNVGYIHVNPELDYQGEFNFIPDVEALVTPNPEKEYAARAGWYQQAKETEATGALQPYRLKHKDILEKMAELINIKNAEQYFEKMEEDELIQAGAGSQGVGPGGQGIPGEQAIPGAAGAPVQPTGPGVPQAGGGPMAGPVPVR
jgi:hypothetical protein